MVRIFRGISSIVEDLIKDLNQNPQRSRSCPLKVSAVKCLLTPSINPYWHFQDWHLNWHLIDISFYSWSLLDQHVDQHLIDSRLTPMHWSTTLNGNLLLTEMLSKISVDWVAIEMSTDFQSRFWSSVDWDANHVMIEMSIKGWSRVSIDARPQLPFIHIIQRS